MKTILALLCAASSLLAQDLLTAPEGLALLQVAPAAGTALTTSLVSWWGLDETSGTRSDLWSTNHLLDATSVSYATGKLTNAADFEYSDATKDYLACADNPALSLSTDTAFSFVCWINLESAGSGTAPILIKATATGSGFEYGLWASGSGPTYALNFRVGNGTSSATLTTNGAISAATWYFIACVHNPSADTLALSVNAATSVTTAWNGGTQDTSSACEVGRIPYGASNTWDGLIDELGLWKRVLAADEITTLYNSGNGYRPF